MSNETKNATDFLFSDIENNETMSVFDNKPKKNQDGIYRPNLDDVTGDKSKGYRALIRFLPNILPDGTEGPSAIEKSIHFVKMDNLGGYYDCEKDINKGKCDLCTLYWKLSKSKNQADVEKAKLVNLTPKYYSYVLVIEDEQHPELVGKLLIYPYNWTIREKIALEKKGEVTGKPCNVFKCHSGKNFRLIIKPKGGNAKENVTYDACQFLESSPITLYDEKAKIFKAAPLDEKGMISNPKVQAKIKEFLMSRTVELNNFVAKEWSDEERNKVSQIIDILSGEIEYTAERKANTAGKDTTVSPATNSSVTPIEKVDASTADDFFSLED